MSFCNTHGIPHSVFMEWDDDDRQKALAFDLEKGTRCQLCGTAEWEWEEDRRAYEPVEQICWGCYYKAIAQEEAGSSMPGTSIGLVNTKSPAYYKSLMDRQRMEAERHGH